MRLRWQTPVLLLKEHARLQCIGQAVPCLQCLVLLSLALRVPEADVHCRRCYYNPLYIMSREPPPVSISRLTEDIAGLWNRLTGGEPRAVFVCVAKVCGSWVPNGHLLLIRNLDLATEGQWNHPHLTARPSMLLCCLSRGPAESGQP